MYKFGDDAIERTSLSEYFTVVDAKREAQTPAAAGAENAASHYTCDKRADDECNL